MIDEISKSGNSCVVNKNEDKKNIKTIEDDRNSVFKTGKQNEGNELSINNSMENQNNNCFLGVIARPIISGIIGVFIDILMKPVIDKAKEILGIEGDKEEGNKPSKGKSDIP